MTSGTSELAKFVKARRRVLGLTQLELAEKAGVGLRFVRDLEQNTKALRTDKILQVLALFGCTLGAIPVKAENGQ